MAVEATSTAAARREQNAVRRYVLEFARAHPLWTVFIVAFVTRIFIAAVLTKYFSGTLVLDDTTYHKMAMQMAEGATASWDDFTNSLYWSTAAFMVPITALYEIFGPSAFVGQMFVAVMGTFAAVFVTGLALEFLSPRWAVVAGAIVALLPSQAFWSSMLMKDASVWFALAGLGAIAAAAARSTGRHLALLGVAAGALLFMLSYLRLHTLVVAVWALIIAAFFGIRQDRLARIAGALVLGITIPWVFGAIGPAGLSLVVNHGSLEERRFQNALGANTAILPTEGIYTQVDDIPVKELEAKAQELETQAGKLESEATRVEPSSPPRAATLREQARDIRGEADALRLRTEKVRASAGTDEGSLPVPTSAGDAPLNANIRHVPRGLSVMLLEPFPLPFAGSISLKLARLESLLWYPLLLLAAIGFGTVRPYLRQMVFPILVGGGIVLMYALSEGNIGTAHRHRGEFVWVVALLAALGLRRLTAKRREPKVEAA